MPNREDEKERALPNVSIPTTVEAFSESAKAQLNTTVTYSHDWMRKHAGANTDVRFDAGDAVTSLVPPYLMTTQDVTRRQTLLGTPLISSEPKLIIPLYDGKQALSPSGSNLILFQINFTGMKKKH